MFPCPAACVLRFGRKSSSSNRSSRRVLCLTMSHCTNSGTKTGRKLLFSRVSEGTLGSFWARFWRRSVLQGHCVSLSGSVLFQLREEEQQQQQEQQEGSMSHYVSCSALHSTDWASSAVQTCPEFIQRLLVALHLSPFFRGRRQGRQPLNPAMPSGGGG